MTAGEDPARCTTHLLHHQGSDSRAGSWRKFCATPALRKNHENVQTPFLFELASGTYLPEADRAGDGSMAGNGGWASHKLRLPPDSIDSTSFSWPCN